MSGIEIERENCIVCGACVAVCPTEALVIEGSELVINAERCHPCGRAAVVCPTGALSCPGAGHVSGSTSVRAER